MLTKEKPVCVGKQKTSRNKTKREPYEALMLHLAAF